MLNYPIVNNHDDLTQVVDLILNEAGLDRKDQGGALTFAGMDPIRPNAHQGRVRVGSCDGGERDSERDPLAQAHRGGSGHPY
jgi:hypothetical protein